MNPEEKVKVFEQELKRIDTEIENLQMIRNAIDGYLGVAMIRNLIDKEIMDLCYKLGKK